MAAAAAAIAVVRVATGSHANGLVRLDNVTVSVVLLIAIVGAVVVRYSSVYLGGDAYERRYVRRLLATLAAVSVVVVANHVLLLVAAWAAASFALHGLLTYFGDRPVAIAVAHKKFLLARVADACMLGAAVAFGTTLSTLRIDLIVDRAVTASGLAAGTRAGILLVAIAAVLKCAQLPFHGWLIQVMEAPTPVSALLHAGVVNLGGVVLLRFAPIVDRAIETRSLLVVTGVLTAVVASLVMTTRVSIKVALAWSTCAQMGFMLMQCGLGLYDLALLHIVAHSLYKAHAFLTAGTAVEQNRLQQMTASLPPLSGFAWLASAGVGVGIVAAAALAWGIRPADAPALWAVTSILALALAPLLAGPMLRAGGWWSLAGIAGAFAVALAYFGLHLVFRHWVGAPTAANMGLVAWVIGCFAVLFIVQGAVRARPQGTLARKLYPWLFAGLYLDELFTRLTFRVWPARLPAKPDAPLPILPEAREPGAL